MLAGGDDRNVWSISRMIITDGKRIGDEPAQAAFPSPRISH
jgi:hypothetical protein